MELRQLLTGILLMVVMVCHASDIFLDFDCTTQSPSEKGITLVPNRITISQDGRTCTFEHTCKALYIAKGFTGLQMGATDSDLRNAPYLFLSTPLKAISYIEVTVRAKFPGGWLEAGCTSDDSPLTDFRLSGTDKLRTNIGRPIRDLSVCACRRPSCRRQRHDTLERFNEGMNNNLGEK